MQGDTAVVLVDSAVAVDAIDVGAAERARDEARDAIEALERRRRAERASCSNAKRRLAIAENELKVAGKA